MMGLLLQVLLHDMSLQCVCCARCSMCCRKCCDSVKQYSAVCVGGTSFQLWHSHSPIQTLWLGNEPHFMQLNAHHCTMVAGGLNEYIWQAWATLEAKQNNVGQARKVRFSVLHVLVLVLRVPCLLMTTPSAFSLVMATANQNLHAVLQRLTWARGSRSCADACAVLQLFDAALVANNKHAASWHGWGLLEKRQGNFRKARDLWMKVRSHAQQLSGSICCAG